MHDCDHSFQCSTPKLWGYACTKKALTACQVSNVTKLLNVTLYIVAALQICVIRICEACGNFGNARKFFIVI